MSINATQRGRGPDNLAIQISVVIPRAIHERLVGLARSNERTLAAEVRRAIKAHVDDADSRQP